jgi:hypothetical protein
MPGWRRMNCTTTRHPRAGPIKHPYLSIIHFDLAELKEKKGDDVFLAIRNQYWCVYARSHHPLRFACAWIVAAQWTRSHRC